MPWDGAPGSIKIHDKKSVKMKDSDTDNGCKGCCKGKNKDSCTDKGEKPDKCQEKDEVDE